MAEDMLQKVKDREDELKNAGLYGRMDADRDLVNLVAGTLNDVKGKAIPRTVFITLNQPALFATNVETALGNATEQVAVLSENKEIDAPYIEGFIKAAFLSASKRLVARGRFALNPFIDQQTCRRGGSAARCLFQVKDGKDREGKSIKVLDTDIVPWDIRYMAYNMGKDGLDWASYRTKRLVDAILAEYPEDEFPKVAGALAGITKAVEVVDIWTKKGNILYIDEKLVLEQPHEFGFCPVAFRKVPLGSMLADEKNLKYEGESLFFLIRDLLPELNRLVSIIQNINIKTLDRVKVWRSQGGQTAPDYEELDTPGTVIAAEMGGGDELVKLGEIQKSAYLLHSMIDSAIQKGSLSDIDLGNLNFELSAVALIEIGEGRDQVFLPRLGTRGLLKQSLAEMAIAQVIQTKESTVEIGTIGHKRTYQVGKLEGDYEIEYRYFSKSTKIDAARWSIAQIASQYMDKRSILADVVQHEDPDKVLRMMDYDLAALISPNVQKNRVMESLLQLAEEGGEQAGRDAQIFMMEMGISLEQAKSGVLLGETEKPVKVSGGTAPSLPVFSGKNTGASESGKRAAELQGTPRELEE